jgi:HEAT repeat protein
VIGGYVDVRVTLSLFFFTLAGPGLAAGQEPDSQEIRFHRIHLHNRNFIDGALVKQTDQELILKIKGGEIGIRLDLVARVEFIKMRRVDEAPEEPPLAKAKPPADTPDPFAGQPAPAPRLVEPPPAPTLAKGPRAASELFQPGGELKKSVDEILEAFEAKDIEQKGAVVPKLVEAEGDTAPYLASLLEQAHPDMFPHLVSALLLKKDPRAVPVLARQLESVRPDVRSQAAAVLAATAAAGSARHVWPLLRDPEAEVRVSAITALRALAEAELLPHLPLLCADPEREVRDPALAAFFDLSKKQGAEEKMALSLAGALEKSQGPATLHLIAVIAKTRKSEAGYFLTPYLDSDRSSVRAATAAALGSLGGPRYSTVLLARLPKERDTQVRLELARALQNLKALKAVGPLIEWLADPDVEIRAAALQALGTLTGMAFGLDREKWAAWRAQEKPGE